MTWLWFWNRLFDTIEELINTRTLLAVGSMAGFYFITTRVLAALTNPPASELYAVMNLSMIPLAGAVGYYFGTKADKGQSKGRDEDE